MTSDELRSHAESIDDESSRLLLLEAAGDVAELERFAAELWCVDRDNAKSTSESDDEELAAWAKGLLATAATLGIDDAATALEQRI